MKNKKIATLPTFVDVEDKTLQAWNRCSVFFNVCEDLGKELGKQYVEKFSGVERASMLVILTSIKTMGYEATKRDLMRKGVL